MFSPSSSSSSALTRPISGKFVGVLFYVGYEFCGWQRQNKDDHENEKNDENNNTHLPTVQEIVENAIKIVTGKEKIIVISSGRTDAGTHSSGQVIHFLDTHLPLLHHTSTTSTSTSITTTITPTDTSENNNNHHLNTDNNNNFNLNDFIFQINQHLPRDVRLLTLQHFPTSFPPHITQFHAKKQVSKKRYSYYIQQGTFMIDWAPFCWYIKRIDVDVWIEELSHLLGVHDFREFATQKEARKTVLEIFSINVSVLQNLNPYFPTDPKIVAENCSNPKKKPSYLLTNSQMEIDKSNAPSIVRIQILGSGFLKHMIRRIIGTLYNIQNGRKKRGLFKELLEMEQTPLVLSTELLCSKKKTPESEIESMEESSSSTSKGKDQYRGGKGVSRLGKSAPSRGLWLENIHYEYDANPYQNLDEKNINWTPFI